MSRPIAFMFPGVGDHYAGMGHGLYQTEPVFRSFVDQCTALLSGHLGEDLREVFHPAGTARGGPSLAELLGRRDGTDNGRRPAAVDRTLFAQPLVFTIEYALARQLMSWGITPSAMVGYSLGEYVAACLAGVMSLEDTVALVARRAELIETVPPGAMLVVLLGEDELAERLDDELWLAAVNGPMLCVAAGTPDAVRRLEARLTEDGVANLRTPTRHAFHSAMMAPLSEPLEQLLHTVELHPPTTPFLSNVTGTWITDEEATGPAYWARHLRQTVRLHAGLGELWRLPSVIAVEVGAGTMLGSLAATHPGRPGGDPPVFATLPGASDTQHDLAALLTVAEKLRRLGVPVTTPHADERDDHGLLAGR
ncbi:acyl transferase domain-containing protein [Kibdelosporangium banguiense]|uniref:Acyl transferase domain-containing protein n=1 Tax=Kibdelosporangium banguiense TaxID=1365924 RepID=A0ABS4TVT7_9PSEU|nr:acyltransferase domain-containing protein [Kibdelosporangium banguiense]MBP2328531.1 acyl transferase domain-containing protein [Kibdelosporangium banguiense]